MRLNQPNPSGSRFKSGRWDFLFLFCSGFEGSGKIRNIFNLHSLDTISMGLMNYIGNFLEERRELSNEKKKKNDVLFEKLSRIPIEKWIYKNHFYSFSSYTRSFLTTLEDGAELCITRNESDLGSSYSMQVNNTPLNDDDYFSDSISFFKSDRGIFFMPSLNDPDKN